MKHKFTTFLCTLIDSMDPPPPPLADEYLTYFNYQAGKDIGYDGTDRSRYADSKTAGEFSFWLHKTQSGRTLPRTLRKRELRAPGCPFMLYFLLFTSDACV
jgi:hypothetical protein